VDLIEAYEYNLIAIKKQYPKLIVLCESKIIVSKVHVINDIITFEKYQSIPEYKVLVSDFKENYRTFMKNVSLTINNKIALTLLKVNASLYKLVISLYRWKHKEQDDTLFN
jgi:hypothetical protein